MYGQVEFLLCQTESAIADARGVPCRVDGEVSESQYLGLVSLRWPSPDHSIDLGDERSSIRHAVHSEYGDAMLGCEQGENFGRTPIQGLVLQNDGVGLCVA